MENTFSPEALEVFIETARTESGRSMLASKNILPGVLELIKSLTDPSTRPLLFLSLKLLRNLCAGEMLNQNSFITEKGVEIISVAMASVGLGSESDYPIVRTGLQVLGNVSLAGEEYQRAVWASFFPERFMEIARVRRLEICDPLCMVIYTSCNESNGRLMELCGVQGLPILEEIIRTGSTVGFEERWSKLLLSRTCLGTPSFSPLFYQLSSNGTVVARNDTKCVEPVFTTEQVFLLSVLSEILNQQIDEVTVSIDFALCVFGILKKAVGVVDSFSRGKSSLPTGISEIDALGYSVTILRDVCAQKDPRWSEVADSTNIVDSLLSSGLLELLLDILGDLEPPEIIKKSNSLDKNPVASAAPGTLRVCPYTGFRRDIVAVIGNCLYQRKHAQDEVRKKNRILLLLQQCVTDEDNPFLREWGIWSVRNLLEGNEENQREVSQLELQGSAEVLGLRVEVDQATRRPKLVNVT